MNNYFILVQRFSQFIYRVVTHVVTYVNIMITVHRYVTLLPARHCKNNCTYICDIVIVTSASLLAYFVIKQRFFSDD